MLERLGRLTTASHYLLLSLTGLLCYGIWWVRMPLTELDEAVYADAAREMLLTRNFLIPHFNFFPFYEKPALTFWLQSLSLRVLGMHETAVRVPSAICSLALVVLVYVFLRHWLVRRTSEKDLPAQARARGAALLAALTLAVAPMVGVWARIATLDAPTTLFTTGALLALLHADLCGKTDNPRADRRRLRRWYLLGALSAGLAVLTKGPIGLLLPALVWLVYHLLQRDLWDEVVRIPWLAVTITFLAVATPWYVATYLGDGPNFLRTFLWNENFARFASIPREGHGFHGILGRVLGLFVYLPMTLLLLFPISAFLLRDLVLPFSGDLVMQRDPALSRMRGFSWVWILAILAFFSLSRTQLPSYVQAIAGGGGILFALNLLARFGGPELPSWRRVRRAWARGLELGALSLCGLVFSVATVLVLRFGESQWVKGVTSLEAVPFPHPATEMLMVAAAILGIVYQAGLWWQWRKSETGMIIWSVCAWVPVWTLLLCAGMLVLNSGYARTVEIGAFLQSQPPSAQALVYHVKHPESLVFYAQRAIGYYNENTGGLYTLAEQVPPAMRSLPTMLAHLAETRQPAIIVTDGPGMNALRRYGHPETLREFGTLVVVRLIPKKGTK